ncbi:MAG: DnaA regulatory inactivator Hda [Thiotrichales bacterium]
MKQLGLPISLDTFATFENFVPGANQVLVDCLRRMADAAGEPQVLLYGGTARGKSHLLQATCRRALARGQSAHYVLLGEQEPGGLPELARHALVCLDGLETVAANGACAEGLFHLINAQRERGHALALASRFHPQALGITLPDLISRLMWGPLFQLQRLDDAALAAFMAQRAAERGFEMPEEVVGYLLTHHARDLRQLLELIDRLDVETLARQRKVTLPLLRSVLDQAD